MKTNSRIILILLTFSAFISCDDPTSSEKFDGVFSGEIISSTTGEAIYPVYIFEEDSLLKIVEESNNYSIELEHGEHNILFSAIGYQDTIISINIDGRTTKEIVLTENSETGRVYGEFQDLLLLQQKIAENNDIANWTEKEIMDGVTGATILEDNSTTDFQQAKLFIADSLVRYADVYGQYWIKIQCGTYPITALSKGYLSETETIKILPGIKVFKNFYLIKQ